MSLGLAQRPPTRVLLVDDHRVFAESLGIALSGHPTIDVVGFGATAREGQRLAIELRPDLVVVDMMLPDTDAVALTRELRRQELRARVLVLSVHDSHLFVREAFEAGANGYALKAQPLTEVVEAMHVVAEGGRYLAPGLTPPPERRPTTTERDLLSRREREIFGLIVQGRSSRDIAQALSISLKTVETHRAHINRKLGVRSPADLVRVAALQGLLANVPSKNKLD